MAKSYEDCNKVQLWDDGHVEIRKSVHNNHGTFIRNKQVCYYVQESESEILDMLANS